VKPMRPAPTLVSVTLQELSLLNTVVHGAAGLYFVYGHGSVIAEPSGFFLHPSLIPARA